MKCKLLLLALLFAGTFAYAATEGQVYKWTDSGGVTHYSDAPPPKDARATWSRHGARALPSQHSSRLPNPRTTATLRLAAAGWVSPARIQRAAPGRRA